MTAIVDQQRQDETPSTCDFLLALENIEQYASERLAQPINSVNVVDEITSVLEMIEGLAQAVRQLYISQAQGWAPVLEDKR